MKKHSQAKRTIIKFETFENQLHINYSDDGIGLSKQFQKKNGLQNTENRIFSCHGSINFDKTTEKGIKINISFPVK